MTYLIEAKEESRDEQNFETEAQTQGEKEKSKTEDQTRKGEQKKCARDLYVRFNVKFDKQEEKKRKM